jgi:hypothetical protein
MSVWLRDVLSLPLSLLAYALLLLSHSSGKMRMKGPIDQFLYFPFTTQCQEHSAIRDRATVIEERC